MICSCPAVQYNSINSSTVVALICEYCIVVDEAAKSDGPRDCFEMMPEISFFRHMAVQPRGRPYGLLLSHAGVLANTNSNRAKAGVECTGGMRCLPDRSSP